MQKYKYTAVNLQNQKIKGTFIAKDERDLAEQLAKQHGITVDKRKITLNDPIKAYGTYALDVRLYTDVAGKINLVVAEA